MTLNAGCAGCSSPSESIVHSLLTCHRSKEVWGTSRFTLTDPSSHGNFTEWLSSTLNQRDAMTTTQISAIMYQIWHNRNQLVNGKEVKSAYHVMTMALHSMEDFDASRRRDKNRPMPSSLSNHSAEHARR
ncbi:hypothetical protein Droror1_Dr00000096 [Drosera rotundifolia]